MIRTALFLLIVAGIAIVPSSAAHIYQGPNPPPCDGAPLLPDGSVTQGNIPGPHYHMYQDGTFYCYSI